jgi:Uma2 family endonuclease
MESAVANPLAVLKPAKQPRRYTLEEYLRREEKSLERHEYYDGKIIRVPMAKGPHNIIGANTITALNIALKSAPKKYIVFNSNQKIYLPPLNFGLYPDALVVCEKPLYWDDNEVLLINPILIVEVLSKSTSAYDRGDKFSEYKTLSSFKEYVLIEQNNCSVESRFREEPDLWRETVVTDPNGHILLKSIGCSLSLADVYENIDLKPAATPKGRRSKI